MRWPIPSADPKGTCLESLNNFASQASADTGQPTKHGCRPGVWDGARLNGATVAGMGSARYIHPLERRPELRMELKEVLGGAGPEAPAGDPLPITCPCAPRSVFGR